MPVFGCAACHWIHRYILALLLISTLVAYLILQLIHLLQPNHLYRWDIEQSRVAMPSLLITGPRLLLENCTITTLGQSAGVNETVNLGEKAHLLSNNTDYIAADAEPSVAWLLE